MGYKRKTFITFIITILLVFGTLLGYALTGMIAGQFIGGTIAPITALLMLGLLTVFVVGIIYIWMKMKIRI